MQKNSIKSGGPGAPRSVPRPGSVSAVGPSGAAPKPRLKNTRDYGKVEPEAPSDLGVNPFGSAGGSSRLGGI
jgi:hypothetical protein